MISVSSRTEYKRCHAKKAIYAFFICILMLTNCSLSENDFTEKVNINFSYCRSNDQIILGLTVKSVEDQVIYPSTKYNISFLVNNEVHQKPFTIYEEWLKKPILPNEPKLRLDYFDSSKLSKMFGKGIKRLKWKYGPIVSNEIVLEIKEDGSIKEISTVARQT